MRKNLRIVNCYESGLTEGVYINMWKKKITDKKNRYLVDTASLRVHKR